MLGEIEFDEWQCIAELTDNAFDDFSEIQKSGQSWPGGFKVSVSLPGIAAPLAGAAVVVQDTGRGMTRQLLEQAVKAGWSSNDRFDKLGLFGMGFNVSTARLGRRTRVLTTRAGDPEWVGVEIDLDSLGADYEAPDITEPKDDPSEHGTRIVIDRLHEARADWLRRNATGLRTTLGRVYGWLLDNKPYELWIQGSKVSPRRACRWGDERYVIYGAGANAEKIPAYIPIDEYFEAADACELCGNWQERGKGVCDQCGSGALQERARHLHGWLGIQRHLDKRDFGIDFLRNGRKILQFDKQLFNWRNPDDPSSPLDVEYPVELANQGGRIIGEIHLDYVPVHYDKSAFEYSDKAWRGAVQYLRGAGPLQPQKAKHAGYPENVSPLGRLFKGYRRNAAGRRDLIPGDGSRPLHEETRQWAQKFWAGDAEYQTDDKWWKQVEIHEARQEALKIAKATGGADAADEDAVLAALGGGDSNKPPGKHSELLANKALRGKGSVASTTAASKTETVQERLARYKTEGTVLQELTREYFLPEVGGVKVEAVTFSGEVLDESGGASPVWLAQGAGGTATAIIDGTHPAFTKLGVEAAELLLVELAAMLKVKSDSTISHSQLAGRLRSACLPDTAVDLAVIRSQASELLSDVRQRMSDRVAQDPQRAVSYLDADEQTITINALIADGGNSMTATLADGHFVRYAPPLFLVRLLENWPTAFMDGKVFIGPYETLPSHSSKRLSLARIVGYFNDVATLLAFETTPNVVQLRRTRLSIQLLQDELAPDES
ncbi:ATP-binding protein [Williamsia muralis]|uniref:ATP-binding protein n=1 Tax=Williamsia marianensis TaxID=85044 RepID=A0ABU4ETE6_WILMA|nr:ATP-binding protein [Williamsia muralis]MDV7134522.1 ATP-binding protein [Williamsia muralis]